MKLLVSLSFVLLAGCSTVHSCSVGLSFIPLGPIVTCGIDAYPDTDAEDTDV